MEILTGLFIVGLYKATEKIWEKGFDAAWTPVGEALKERFTRWRWHGTRRWTQGCAGPLRLPRATGPRR